MKIKNKLRIGFGFLFIVVLFFGAISAFFINEIASSAKVILKDNYESLGYSSAIRTTLDQEDFPLNNKAVSQIGANLNREESNVTEPGEREAVTGLRNVFNALQNQSASPLQLKDALRQARGYLRKIEVVNMQAIVTKNEKAHASVRDATLFLGLAGTVTFLLLFSFSVNFPGIISQPLSTLIDGIREISKKKLCTTYLPASE